ncbi:MAG: hypothetical protein R3344_01715 [Acidobacteriota bacterium]|nr:hypothetical protein [Acidobacteriota bacterium]
MGRIGGIGVLIVAYAAFAVQADPTGPQEQLEAFNQRIIAELEADNPHAAELFVRADEARDAGLLETAAYLYARVRELQPDFVHASRRLCLSLLAMDQRVEALGYCREASVAEESAENLAALALVLARSTPQIEPTPDELDEAERLSVRASAAGPDDFFSQTVLCEVAMIRFNLGNLRTCTARLERIAPDEVVTPYFATILAIGEERRDDALASLQRAWELGLPDDTYAYLSGAIGEESESASPYRGGGWPPTAMQVAAILFLHLAVVYLVWTGLRGRRVVISSRPRSAAAVAAERRRSVGEAPRSRLP